MQGCCASEEQKQLNERECYYNRLRRYFTLDRL